MPGLFEVANLIRERSEELKRQRSIQPPPQTPHPQQQPKSGPGFSYLGEAYNSLARSPYDALGRISSTAGFVTGRPEFHDISQSIQQRGQQQHAATPTQLPSMDDVRNNTLADTAGRIAQYTVGNVGQVPASMMALMPVAATAKVGLGLAGAKVASAAPGVIKAMDASPALVKMVTAVGGVENALNLASNFIASTLQQAGGMSGEAYAESGEMPDRSQVTPWAIAGGALGSFHPTLLQSIINKTGSRELAAEASRQFANYGVEGLVNVAQSMGLEFGVNYLQEIFQVASVTQSGSGESGPSALMSTLGSDEAQSRAIGAGISGAVGGGVMRAGAEIMSGRNVAPSEPRVFKGRPSDVTPDTLSLPGPESTPPPSSGDFYPPAVYSDRGQATTEFDAAIERVKTPTPKSDIGGFSTKAEVQAVSEVNVAKNMMKALGVPENMQPEFVMETMGKPMDQLSPSEIDGLKSIVADMLVAGETLDVSADMQAMPIHDPQSKMTPPDMGIADRPSDMAPSDQQSQPMGLQDAIARIQQPQMQTARPEMGMSQPQEMGTGQVDEAEFQRMLQERMQFKEYDPSQQTIEIAPEPKPEIKTGPDPVSDRQKLSEINETLDSIDNYLDKVDEVRQTQDLNPEVIDRVSEMQKEKKALEKEKKGLIKAITAGQKKEQKEARKAGAKVMKIPKTGGTVTSVIQDEAVSIAVTDGDGVNKYTAYIGNDGRLTRTNKDLFTTKDPKQLAALRDKAAELEAADNNLEDYRTVVRPLQDELAAMVQEFKDQAESKPKPTQDLQQMRKEIIQKYEAQGRVKNARTRQQLENIEEALVQEGLENRRSKPLEVRKYGTGTSIAELHEVDFVDTVPGEQTHSIGGAVVVRDSDTNEILHVMPVTTLKDAKRRIDSMVPLSDSNSFEETISRLPTHRINEYMDKMRELGLVNNKEEHQHFKTLPEAVEILRAFIVKDIAPSAVDKAKKAMEKFRDSKQDAPAPAPQMPTEQEISQMSEAQLKKAQSDLGAIEVALPGEYTDEQRDRAADLLSAITKRQNEISDAKFDEQEMAEPMELDVGTPGNINIANLGKALVPFVRQFQSAGKPLDNVKLKKALQELGVDTKDNEYSHKITQEAIESAIVMVVREQGLHGDNDATLKMYLNQPLLKSKTADSKFRQAYSTPAPLASMITNALNLPDRAISVYEPTAGNGLLLSSLPENKEGTKNEYYLNELDSTRLENLKSLFPDAEITDNDGLTHSPPNKVDLVIANPPFGAMPKPVTEETIRGFKRPIRFTKIEHAIAWQALKSMNEDGKAAIIIGAEMKEGITGAQKVYYNALYNQYNVTGHFELDGDLYGRQGAQWPVSVVIIDGRKDFPTVMQPAPDRVERAKTWDDVRRITDEIKSGSSRSGADEPADERGSSDKPGDSGIQSGRSPDRGPKKPKGPKPADLSEALDAVTGDKRPQKPKRDSAGDIEPAGDRGELRLDTEPDTRGSKGEGSKTKGPAIPEPDRLDTDVDSGVETEFQTKYKPVSKGFTFNALTPRNLANPTRDALQSILKDSGYKSLNDFVAAELGYKSGADIPFFASEQIDALSEIFVAFSKKAGHVVADQTGVGKGRVAAGALKWAKQNGKVGIFMTEKPTLFSDIYRDLRDVDAADLRPFIVNEQNSKMTYEDDLGKIHTAYKHSKTEYKRVMANLATGDMSDFGPNGKYDYIAMTYSQFQHHKSGPKKLAALLGGEDYILVMDEAHTAAGPATKKDTRGKAVEDEDINRIQRSVLSLLNPEKSSGVAYLSATWAKTQNNVPLYYRAFAQSGISTDQIKAAFSAGGAAMQEMQVASMAGKGAYVRREQSFEGVEWERVQSTEDSKKGKEQRKLADQTMGAVREMMDLDGIMGQVNQRITLDDLIAAGVEVPAHLQGGEVEAVDDLQKGVDQSSSPFSQVHNYTGTFLAALKAEDTADRAIEKIRAGEKPVIAIQHTRGSHIDLAVQLGTAKENEAFNGTFRDTLKVMTSKLRTISVKDPLSNKKVRILIPLDFYPENIQAMFEKLDRTIDKAEIGDLPFSPIDIIKSKLATAGFSCGEITGRDKYLDYSEPVDGKPVLRRRKMPDRNDEIRKFNNGTHDAILFNVAGATGMSIHSSEKFADQRRRVMLILQPFDDINKFTQALGRIHRNGAVTSEDKVTSVIEGKPAKYGHPRYEYIQTSLMMEQRPAIQLEKKMKSLNANTTSSERGQRTIAEVDLINKYGTEVMNDWLQRDSNQSTALTMGVEDDKTELTAEQATGRIAILPQEIQNTFWSEVTREYIELIDSKNATGTNDLIIKSYDNAEATTISKTLLHGKPGSTDDPPVYHEEIEMTIAGNPTSLSAAFNRIQDGISNDEIEERDRLFNEYLKRKRAQNAERRAEEKSEPWNIPAIEVMAGRVKKALNDIVPGAVMYNDKNQIGVVTKTALSPIPTTYDANPWSPGLVKVNMAAPNTGGGIIITLAGIAKLKWTVVDKLDTTVSADEAIAKLERNPKTIYNKQFDDNATRRIKTEIVTGDMLMSASMVKYSQIDPVQIGRDDGTRDFAWLKPENVRQALTITPPILPMTPEQLRNPPPAIYSTDSKEVIQIGQWEWEARTDHTGKRVNDWVLDEKPDTFQIWLRSSAKNLSKEIMQDPALREAIRMGPQDEFFEQESRSENGRKVNYFVTKRLPISMKVSAVSRINRILKDMNSFLHAPVATKPIDVEQLKQTRRGSAGILNMFAEYTAEKSLSALEKAYNMARGGGSAFMDFIKAVAGELRGITPSTVWRDAQRLVKYADEILKSALYPALNKRGSVSWRDLQRIAKERAAELRPQPQAERIVRETVTEAYRAGKEKGAEKAQAVQEKLNNLKSQNRQKKLISSQGKRFLLDLASKLPPEDQVRIMKRIVAADTVLSQADVINVIDKKITQREYSKAAKRLQQAMRAANKLHPDFQRIANDIKGDMRDTAPMIEGIDRILRHLQYRDDVIIDPKTVGSLSTILKEAPPQLTADTLNTISEVLELLKFMSEQEVEKMFDNDTKNMEQAVAAINYSIEEHKNFIKSEGVVGGFAQWYMNIGALQWEAIAETMGPVGLQTFHKDVMRANRAAKRLWHQGRDTVKEAMKEAGKGLGDSDTIDWLEESVTVNTVTGPWKMTRNQKMNLVANLMDEQTAPEILRAGAKLRPQDSDVYTFNEALVALAKNSLTKEEAVMVDAMRDFLHGPLAKKVNQMWVSLAGYEKALNPTYWPRTRDGETTGFNAGYRNYVMSNLEELGIFKERVTSKKAVVIGDITQVYQWHIRKASSFAGMGKTLRNIEMMLGAGGLGKSLTQKFGPHFVERIKEQIEVIADMGRAARDPMSMYVRSLINNIAVSYLGLNPRSAVRQLGGLITLATELPESMIARHLKKAFNQEIKEEIFEYSPELRDRFESAAASLVENYYGDKDMVRPEVRRKQMMALLRVFDRAPIQVAWECCKEIVSRDNPELKGQEYWDAVADMTETMVNRTQNISSPLGMSGVAIRARMQPVYATVNLFQSFGNSVFNNMRRQAKRVMSGEITPIQFSKNMLLLSVGLAMFGAFVSKLIDTRWIKDLFKGEEKEVRTWGETIKQIGFDTARQLASTVHGGGVAHALMYNLNRIASGKPTFGGPAKMETPVGSVANNAISAIESLAKAAYADGEFERGRRKGQSKSVAYLKDAGISGFRSLSAIKGIPQFPFNEAVKIMR